MRTLTLLTIFIILWGTTPIAGAPKIILKLDDLSVSNGVCKFSATLDYLVQKQLKAALGVIANELDSTAPKTLYPYLDAKNSAGENLFEIWNHGLDHIRPEFQGTDFSYQKTHFDMADEKIKKIVGIQMHTFGTPFNGSDINTNKVVAQNENYKVFLLSSVVPDIKNGILYLNHRTNMEDGTGNPKFSFLRDNYLKNKNLYKDYMVLQGHPNMWTPEKIAQFKKIIDFLISEGCEFVLPFDYYKSYKAQCK